jgi:hypothetical protein
MEYVETTTAYKEYALHSTIRNLSHSDMASRGMSSHCHLN